MNFGKGTNSINETRPVRPKEILGRTGPWYSYDGLAKFSQPSVWLSIPSTPPLADLQHDTYRQIHREV